VTPIQLLALSLGLSVAVAALGLTTMRLLERRVADPVIRERAWGAVLHLSALPPVIVAALLMLPPQVRSVGAAAVQFEAPVAVLSGSESLPNALSAFEAHGATVVLAIAALLLGLRGIVLLDRLLRLRGLLAASTPAGPDLRRIMDETARRMRVAPPAIRVSVSGSEAFLAGLRIPILVIPAALAAAPDRPETRAICAHELAHLKRGDHRALWLEEAVLSALAINPLLGLIRDHRAAAREEACDAAALAGADVDVRRQYARSLLAALQDPAFGRDVPALTFTSARRTFVMRRLKAILAPVSPSGRRSRLAMTGVGVLIAGVAGAGSLAVAAQRDPVTIARVAPVPATEPAPPAALAPAATTAPVAEPVAPVVPLAPAHREVAPEPPVLPVQTAEPVAGVITNPAWTQPPIPRLPATALSSGVAEGRVRLTCTAEADGRLSDCSVVNETPAGVGFGAAAIEAAESSRISTEMIDPATDRPTVTFGVRFRLPD
jgi:beta-lactamase regulating signal transducer with metallopeptidase domain